MLEISYQIMLAWHALLPLFADQIDQLEVHVCSIHSMSNTAGLEHWEFVFCYHTRYSRVCIMP